MSAAGFVAASDSQAGPIGLALVVVLGIVVAFLGRSMTRHLRRVPASFDRSDPAAAGAPAPTGEAGPTDRPAAADEPGPSGGAALAEQPRPTDGADTPGEVESLGEAAPAAEPPRPGH